MIEAITGRSPRTGSAARCSGKAVAAAAAALLWALAACDAGTPAAGPEPVSSAQAPALALGVDVKQYRADVPRRVFAIGVTNHESRPVVIEQVQLRSQDFDVAAPVGSGATLRPAGTVDIRSGYGAPRCPQAVPSGDGDAQVIARVRPEGGSAQEVTLPVEDPEGLLVRVRDRECRQERLSSLLTVELLPEWRRSNRGGKPHLEAMLSVRRRGPQVVTVQRVDGSAIFEVQLPPGQQPVRLDAGTERVDVPVEIRAARCEPHALAETQRHHYEFSVLVSAAEDPPEPLAFRPDDAGRARLLAEQQYLCSG